MFIRMYLTAESNVSVVCEMQSDALLLLFPSVLTKFIIINITP